MKLSHNVRHLVRFIRNAQRRTQNGPDGMISLDEIYSIMRRDPDPSENRAAWAMAMADVEAAFDYVRKKARSTK
jgi:hypothetical protein